jgi:hypothetical protein
MALVIGISDYADGDDHDLDRPWRDARGIGKALAATDFAVTELLEDEAARNNLLLQIKEFAQKLKPGSVVLFYYAGHGIQSNGVNYILPQDYQFSSGKLDTAVRFDWVIQQLKSTKPETQILLFDACRTTSVDGKGVSGLAPMDQSAFGIGSYVVMSAEPGKEALDGLFAKHLIEALAQPGLSLASLFARVRKGVYDESKGLQTIVSYDRSTARQFFFRNPQSPGLSAMSEEQLSKEFDTASAKFEMYRMHLSSIRDTIKASQQVSSATTGGGAQTYEYPKNYRDLEERVDAILPAIQLARAERSKENLVAALTELRPFLNTMEDLTRFSREQQEKAMASVTKMMKDQASKRAARSAGHASNRIQVTVVPQSLDRVMIAGLSPFVQLSTDGGKTFKTERGGASIEFTPETTLLLRTVDESGKELERVDRTAFLRSELTRSAKETLPRLHRDDTSPSGSGCSFYGCRFREHANSLGFCSPGVRRAWLSNSKTSFTHEVDRTACKGEGFLDLCVDFPHLPFPIKQNEPIYAKVDFIDGSTRIEVLPVNDSVLERASMAIPRRTGRHEATDWTKLEPLGKDPSPFVAATYVPSYRTAGGFLLFVGLRGCSDKGTNLRPDGLLVDVDGKGLVRQNITGSKTLPLFGSAPGGKLSEERVQAMVAEEMTIQIAADTVMAGRLGPFSYRFSPRQVLMSAVKQLGDAKLKCARAYPHFRCVAEEPLAWVAVKEVRFGPAYSELSTVVPVNFTLEDYFKTSDDASNREPVRFQPPAGWTDVFHQIVFADGRTVDIERAPVVPW